MSAVVPLADCFLLLTLGAIPLFVLEMVKLVQHARRQNAALIKR